MRFEMPRALSGAQINASPALPPEEIQERDTALNGNNRANTVSNMVDPDGHFLRLSAYCVEGFGIKALHFLARDPGQVEEVSLGHFQS